MAFAYKILFGVVDLCVNSHTLFMLRNQPHLRGHKYTLTKPCTRQVRQGFLVQELLIYGTIYTSRHDGL